jgi:hypothetical protein
MAIQGLRATDDWQADQRPKDWLETILLLFPATKQQAPLTALRTVMSKKVAVDPEFNWFEKKFDDQRLALTASITNVATAIPVVDGSGVRTGHLLFAEQTGEIMRLTADPVSPYTTVTVARGQAGTAGTAITFGGAGVNPNLLVIGTAHEEGSGAPAAISRNPIKRNNFTQIFRNTLGMTRTAKQTRLRTGQQVAESKRECLEYHTVEMERGSIWGKKTEDLTGTTPRRYTQGLLDFITLNTPADQIVDWLAETNQDMVTFETVLERMFRFGSTEKVAFCGTRALLTLQTLVRINTQYNISAKEKEYGISVMRLDTPFGTLVIKRHPLFDRVAGGITAATPFYGMDSSMVILDMASIKWRFLQGSDTQFESNLQANGLDGMLSGYLTEGGYEWHHPDTFGWIKKFTVAEKDA